MEQLSSRSSHWTTIFRLSGLDLLCGRLQANFERPLETRAEIKRSGAEHETTRVHCGTLRRSLAGEFVE
jgi:hypothetical protein